MEEHNTGKTRSTSGKGPWKVVYTEEFVTRSEAMQREIFLKKQRNKSFYKKLCGISHNFPHIESINNAGINSLKMILSSYAII